jgi:hypothetical protein
MRLDLTLRDSSRRLAKRSLGFGTITRITRLFKSYLKWADAGDSKYPNQTSPFFTDRLLIGTVPLSGTCHVSKSLGSLNAVIVVASGHDGGAHRPRPGGA